MVYQSPAQTYFYQKDIIPEVDEVGLGMIGVGKPKGEFREAKKKTEMSFWLRYVRFGPCFQSAHIFRFPSDSSTNSGMEVDFEPGDVSIISGNNGGNTVNPGSHDPPVF